jgi:hypothetical protein
MKSKNKMPAARQKMRQNFDLSDLTGISRLENAAATLAETQSSRHAPNVRWHIHPLVLARRTLDSRRFAPQTVAAPCRQK